MYLAGQIASELSKVVSGKNEISEAESAREEAQVAIDRFQRNKSDPSVIVFSGIRRCQHPHFTQFFKMQKRYVGEASGFMFPVKLPDIESDLGNLYAESGQTLQGSFSAVSNPNVASK